MASRSLASLSNNRSSTSLITPAVTALSDPIPALIDAHFMEFLTAEVIRLITESELYSRTKRQALEKQVEADLASSLTNGVNLFSLKEQAVTPLEFASTQAATDEAIRSRLDTMGFKMGWALAERLARDRLRIPSSAAPTSDSSPSSTPLPPIPDPLETVKFICKDVWVALYDKQIDNLRTNHRGVYVLQDNSFKPLSRVSGALEDESISRRVTYFLALPSGVIRGALANLGLSCTVTGETIGLPQSTFQIKTIKPGN